MPNLKFSNFTPNFPIKIKPITLYFGYDRNFDRHKEYEIKSINFVCYTRENFLVFDFYYKDGFAVSKTFWTEESFNKFIENCEALKAGKVIKKFLCLHLVHFDDYDSEWDEWMAAKNIEKK